MIDHSDIKKSPCSTKEYFVNQRNYTPILIFLLGIFLNGGLAHGQQRQLSREDIRDIQQFRIAQRYQRNIEHENAVRLLQSLYERNKGNTRYYHALLTSYLALSRFEEARALIQQQQALSPPNPRYEIDYGNVLFKAGQPAEAQRVWEETIKKYPNNVGVYAMLAAVQIENRLYDAAAKTYQEAYRQHPDKAYLLHNLADFYRQQFKYQQALMTYLEYIEKEPQSYQNVLRSILSFNLEAAQVDSLAEILEKKRQRARNSPEIQIITAKFYQKHQRYQQALAIFERLENEQTAGKYLIDFGQAVQGDSLYELALQAYERVIERFPNADFALTAYLGAARCNLELARQKNDQLHARKAIEMIHQVQRRYPSHPKIAELQLMEGDIYRLFFFDIDQALKIYLELAEKYADNKLIEERALRNAGESYIIRGDLEAAKKILSRINHPHLQAEAELLLARIAFYQADYEAARQLIGKILQQQGFSGAVANDALALQSILTHQSAAPEALKQYAAADLLLFQQKKSEAISKLENALAAAPPPHFRIKILFEAANLAAEVGKYPEALAFCNQALQDPALQLYADEALFIMAGIVDHKLNDTPRAFQLYDQLLAGYPESQFAIPARVRLKELRRLFPDLMP